MDCGVGFYDKQNVCVIVRHDNDSELYSLYSGSGVYSPVLVFSVQWKGKLCRGCGWGPVVSSLPGCPVIESTTAVLPLPSSHTERYNGCVVSLSVS